MNATTSLNNLPGRFSFVMLAFSLLLLLNSCARKVAFQTSPVVPAAEGSVKIKRDQNNNYLLDVSIRNLAESKRLEPPRETYVVWIETERNGTNNVGQIISSTGLFSSKLKASLSATTTFKPNRIFITAEDNASVAYPGPQLVLSTKNF